MFLYVKRLFKNSLITLIIFIISCLGVLCYFHPSTTFDEKYTLLLVTHRFSSLINLDSLDVHPPFYYILLKYFLIITTFWTKSIFIKIIFARILSLIFSVITYIYIYKIFKFSHMRIHAIYLWILFILLPNSLGSLNPYSTEPIVDIRMYSLSAMIIVMEFYYLLEILKNIQLYLIIISILSTLAMYTHYFAAIISVMMIITFFVKFILLKKNFVAIKLSLSLFISILLYLPWLPFLYNQISIPPKETFNAGIKGTSFHIIIFIFVCLILSYPIFWSKYHLNKQLNILSLEIGGTLLLTLLFVSTILLILRPMFNYRYMYPIFLLYELYALDILFEYMLNNKNKLNIYAFMISIILLFNFIGSSYYQLRYIDLPTIKIDRNIVQIIKTRKKRINLNPKYDRAQLQPNFYGGNHQYEIDETPINFEYAFFLSNHCKYVHSKNLHGYFGINKKPAYKPVFKNVDSHIIDK